MIPLIEPSNFQQSINDLVNEAPVFINNNLINNTEATLEQKNLYLVPKLEPSNLLLFDHITMDYLNIKSMNQTYSNLVDIRAVCHIDLLGAYFKIAQNKETKFIFF